MSDLLTIGKLKDGDIMHEANQAFVEVYNRVLSLAERYHGEDVAKIKGKVVITIDVSASEDDSRLVNVSGQNKMTFPTMPKKTMVAQRRRVGSAYGLFALSGVEMEDIEITNIDTETGEVVSA